ncbi:phosphopantetheine-binding protein [Acinetobacter sp. GXMZU3951]
MSEKGIIYAVAEQLALDPLELDLFRDWAEYNLDSVAVVSLVGLWRANGADIRYEDVIHSRNLKKLIQLLRHNS